MPFTGSLTRVQLFQRAGQPGVEPRDGLMALSPIRLGIPQPAVVDAVAAVEILDIEVVSQVFANVLEFGAGLLAALLVMLVLAGMARLARRHLGGQTGDVIGASNRSSCRRDPATSIGVEGRIVGQ